LLAARAASLAMLTMKPPRMRMGRSLKLTHAGQWKM